MRLRLLLLLGVLLTQPACAERPARAADAGWPDWQAFKTAFVSDDGRVIDWTTGARTVSEGQAYGLFFALVANDREAFARILRWTERNLADGDLSRKLPAWLWGTADDGTRKVLDANPATDADLWIAYSLLEAARLWQQPQYAAEAQAILALVRRQVVERRADGTALLLPAPDGFRLEDRVRLNPSYTMPAQFLRFHAVDPDGPWSAMVEQFPAMLAELSPLGRVPDWSQYRERRHEIDADKGGVGSYDAIRVYLWAGLGPAGHPALKALQPAVAGFAVLTEEAGRVPEKWSARSTWIEGDGPVGFDAALLPFYRALGEQAQLERARERVVAARQDGVYGSPARYYDQVLVLFGKGYDDGQYHFDGEGRLVPKWKR
ncbi:MAG: cellulose synthase complex periplasmic endoglucanase BcsZ [Sinimarinibacterium flocculans]|uniref:cellulose synthase complex periplasmic endoglucanase BcsZ n=1 Tax=Sinimarinibacterium flocculans TaxID=985250 RepID=UPI003C4BFDF0